MKPSAVEYGTFWVADAAHELPVCSARVETTFQEIDLGAVAALQAAMSLLTPDAIRHRLETGRRCFSLLQAGQIICYGWVSRGMESVGELERDFQFQDDEVYIWDCGTIPPLRGNRCYSALLNQIIRQCHREGIQRVWIGASSLNQPSIRGIINAGFQHVVDMIYRRFGPVKWLRFYKAPEVTPIHLTAAYRILLDGEWRVGSAAMGLKR